MQTTLRSTNLIAIVICFGILMLLAACSGKSDGGTTPQPQTPIISSFTASPTDFGPGDSTNLVYVVTGADSVVLVPPYQKMTSASTGSIYVKPMHPIQYLLRAFNGAGQDTAYVTIAMADWVPAITSVSLDRDSITQRDSVCICYHSLRADSLVLNHGGKLNVLDSLARLAPMGTTNYVLIAYNNVGTDTTRFTISVDIPFVLTPVGGIFYKGQLSSSVLAPELAFRVTDMLGTVLHQPWVHLVRKTGDGLVSADSLRADLSGLAKFTYTFSDTMGSSILRAFVRGFDTVDVTCRADAVILGPHGQGQYVRFDDLYSMVTNFNGTPAITYGDPSELWSYANYATLKGVVAVIEDPNHNGKPEPTEHVFEMLFVAPYQGKTHEGIGIGSHYNDIVAAYGAPKAFILDTIGTDRYLIDYTHIGLILVSRLSDTTVVQMEVSSHTSLTAKRPSGPFPIQGQEAEIVAHFRAR